MRTYRGDIRETSRQCHQSGPTRWSSPNPPRGSSPCPINKMGLQRRPGCGKPSNLHNHGLEIVDLALAGFMGSRTIRAFLNFYGYTDVEEPINKNDAENAVIAVGMDSKQFNCSLRRALLQQLSLPQSSATSAQRPGSDGQGSVNAFPIHLLQEVLGQCTAGDNASSREIIS